MKIYIFMIYHLSCIYLYIYLFFIYTSVYTHLIYDPIADFGKKGDMIKASNRIIAHFNNKSFLQNDIIRPSF